MLWLALFPLAVLVAAAALLPLAPLRSARRTATRLDGTLSTRRLLVERAHARRHVVSAAAVPVGAVATLSVAALALFAFVPWSPLAAVFGDVSPETDVVSPELFEAYRARVQAERAERLDEAIREGRRPPRPSAAEAARNQPAVTLAVLVLLGLASLSAVGYTSHARRRYLRRLRERRRRYYEADQRRLERQEA